MAREEESMPNRHNLFDFPHKAFRFMWMDVVSTIGTTDPGSQKALEQLDDKVKFAVDSYAHHNEDESTWFAPRLRELDAPLADKWVADHEENLHAMESLKERLRTIRDESDPRARAAMLADYYRDACDFLAEDLMHMAMEQNEVMGVFQRAFTDEQLRDLEVQFIAERIDPAYMKGLTPLFLRACNLDERTMLLSLIKRQVPSPEAFQGLLGGLVASIVPAEELAQIRARLEGA
jgi:hypothetical protein